jgi:hypothetical protein
MASGGKGKRIKSFLRNPSVTELKLTGGNYNRDNGTFSLNLLTNSIDFDPWTRYPLNVRVRKYTTQLQLQSAVFDVTIQYNIPVEKKRFQFNGDIIANDFYGTVHSSSLQSSFTNYNSTLSLGDNSSIQMNAMDEVLKVGKNNFKLPKGTDAEKLTFEECKEIEASQAKPARKSIGKAAPKAKAKPKAKTATKAKTKPAAKK